MTTSPWWREKGMAQYTDFFIRNNSIQADDACDQAPSITRYMCASLSTNENNPPINKIAYRKQTSAIQNLQTYYIFPVYFVKLNMFSLT